MNIKNLSNSLLTSAALGLATALSATSAAPVQAAAVIFNNATPGLRNVALGVNNAGHLNFFDSIFRTSNAGSTGLARKFADGSWRDATAPGCLCEGWGVAGTPTGGFRSAGWANQASGSGGLGPGTFGSTVTTATSQINLSTLPINVVHAYGPSLAPNTFQGNVTLTNTGTQTIKDVVYRRVMDWDVPPTEFYEYVSHYGVTEHLVSAGGNVRFASDNGFATSNPNVGASWINSSTVNTNFVKNGPTDHGSVFDFAFGDLAPGSSRTFNIFYGAGANLAEAQAAITFIKPDLWSFGQSATASPDDNPTFLFAFGGVGGVEPGTNPSNPILPFVPAPGTFEFPAPIPRRWFDPPFVSRYDYSLSTGKFLSFKLPPGFGSTIDLYVGDTLLASDLLGDGTTEYYFSSLLPGTDVTAFSLRDILPLTGVDAADPTAFPTFLDFTTGGTLTMKAVPAAAVPEPLTILGTGVVLGALPVLKKEYAKRNKKKDKDA